MKHLAQFWIGRPLKSGSLFGRRQQPHWHILLFCPAHKVSELKEIVSKHALKDSPNEKGASEHRCDFKELDPAKGSAVGYIAKYISKNIDGHGVGEDFNGGSAVANAIRVEAWAAVWGIRQFQFFGGPPVGPWREIRRVPSLPVGAPEHLRQAHQSANPVNVVDGRSAPAVAYDLYCKAQGGVFCGRNARIKVSMHQPETLGRYGDLSTPRPVGVETTSREVVALAWNPTTKYERVVHWLVPSVRHEWQILRRPSGLLVERSEFAKRAQPAQPRTRVNNCTAAPRAAAPTGAAKIPVAELADLDGLSQHRTSHDQPLKAYQCHIQRFKKAPPDAS